MFYLPGMVIREVLFLGILPSLRSSTYPEWWSGRSFSSVDYQSRLEFYLPGIVVRVVLLLGRLPV